MPFFENANSVTITGSTFTELNGDQNIYNGHLYNVNSFNKTNTKTSGSHNDSSSRWNGTGGYDRSRESIPSSPRRNQDAHNLPNHGRTPFAQHTQNASSNAPTSSTAANGKQNDNAYTPLTNHKYPFLPDEEIHHLREISEVADRLQQANLRVTPPAARVQPVQEPQDVWEDESDEEPQEDHEERRNTAITDHHRRMAPATTTTLSAPSPPLPSVSPAPSSSAVPEISSPPVLTSPSSTSSPTSPSTSAQTITNPQTQGAKSKNPLGRVNLKRLFQKKISTTETHDS